MANATSILGGVVLYDPAEVGADRFCDTGIIRDGVLNNALHKADESAQHVVTWAAPAAALWTADDDPFMAASWLENFPGVWYTIPPVGTYAARVHSAGHGYRLRIKIAGASSAGHSVDFAVVVFPRWRWPWGLPAGWGTIGSWPKILFSGITSTSAAMLSPDTFGYLDVPKSVIDEALAGPIPSTLTDIGGATVSHRVPMLSVMVMAKTTNASSVPELHLLTVHEVVGGPYGSIGSP